MRRCLDCDKAPRNTNGVELQTIWQKVVKIDQACMLRMTLRYPIYMIPQEGHSQCSSDRIKCEVLLILVQNLGPQSDRNEYITTPLDSNGNHLNPPLPLYQE